jgi:hypothetical protein
MQARGNAFANEHVQLNYIGWFSKRQDRFSLNGTRAIGDRVEVLFPNKGIEIGTSFTRRLQDTRYNSVGTHFYWLASRSPFQVRAEYAHDPHSQGYWIENSYRLSQWRGPDSLLGRVEPLFRLQQNATAERLAALSRTVEVTPQQLQLGTLRLEISGNTMAQHLNKYGEPYKPLPRESY